MIERIAWKTLELKLFYMCNIRKAWHEHARIERQIKPGYECQIPRIGIRIKLNGDLVLRQTFSVPVVIARQQNCSSPPPPLK